MISRPLPKLRRVKTPAECGNLRLSVQQLQEDSLLDRIDNTIIQCSTTVSSKTVSAQQRDSFAHTVPREKVLGMKFLMAGWQAALWFPMSVHLTVGPGCTPDFRICAFQLASGLALEHQGNVSEMKSRGFWAILRKCFCFFKKFAAMAALHMFLPGTFPFLQKIVCVSGLVNAFLKIPPLVQELDLSALNSNLSTTTSEQSSTQLMEMVKMKDRSSFDMFWSEILKQIMTPIVLFHSSGKIWRFLHPESHYILQCSISLLEIDRDYKKLSRAISEGKIQEGAVIEKAWLDTHKKAAQKVAHLQRELPDHPPLKHLIDFWECSHIYIGHLLSPSSSSGSSHPVQYLANDPGNFSLIWTIDSPKGEEKSDPLFENIGVLQEAMRGSYPWPVRKRSLSEIYEFPLEAELDMSSPSDCEVDNDHGDDVVVEYQETMELCLYGRTDHQQGHPEKENKLKMVEKMEVTLRGVELLLAFLPFFLLGLFLLLLAYALDSKSSHSTESVRSSSRKKCVHELKINAFQRLLQGCRDSGAAFIKWGQWSASRADLFPSEFCDVLSELHDQAPTHGIKETRKEILKAYGRPIEEIFDSFDYRPLASGSVAQVHKATYRFRGHLIPVVVKIRHPNVARQIKQDFQILKPLAHLAQRLPTLKNLPLRESVSQFSSTMTAQTDLRVEAAHMLRFWKNFHPVRQSIVIPQVIPELISESVLVESYEEGKSVSHFVKNPSRLNTKIVTLGVDAYLRMLLLDNFIHTDLHPGNIMVREIELENGEKTLQIVLLDFGLAEELQPKIRKHFISFLNMICKGDGVAAAHYLLQWSDEQSCRNPAAFIEEMHALFCAQCNIQSPAGIDLDMVMKSVLRLARKHEVAINGSYASLVIGVCIIVGFAQGLDPRVNLMDAAAPVLLTYALTGRVVGRLYG